MRSVVLAVLVLSCWPLALSPGTQALAAAPELQARAPGADCTVTPRRRRDLVELANAPVGTARSPLEAGPGPSGVTVEEVLSGNERGTVEADTARSVEATARQLAACYNAGDLRRLFALYSRDYLFATWGGFAGSEPASSQVDEVIAFISQPVPLPVEQHIETVTVEEVWSLPAGRVAAVVSLDEVRLLLVFLYTDGWYQVEEAYDLTGSETTGP